MLRVRVLSKSVGVVSNEMYFQVCGCSTLRHLEHNLLKKSWKRFELLQSPRIHLAGVKEAGKMTTQRCLETNDTSVYRPQSRINTGVFKKYIQNVSTYNTRRFSSDAKSMNCDRPTEKIEEVEAANLHVTEDIHDHLQRKIKNESKSDKSKKAIKRKDLSNTTVNKEVSEADPQVDLTTVAKLFPFPKNTLHAVFGILSKELGLKQSIPTPSYIHSHRGVPQWTCSYKIKWPQDMKFSCQAVNKKDAGTKAALLVLQYLFSNKRISPEGYPIVFDKDQVVELKKSKQSTLLLDKSSVDKLTKICDIYTKNLADKLSNFKEQHVNDTYLQYELQNEEVRERRYPSLRFGNPQRYICNEKLKLPISDYKEKFVDLLRNNSILIVKGQPGCGKSTRVPQYILEDWASEAGLLGEPCRIAVTQPRRIAAITLADRVASERNERSGQLVGYQVRFDSNFNPHEGRILYCTTGILLRYLQKDPNLKEFTHVVLDEAHERDVNTDLLMNLLRSAVCLNENLKLIVMSATLDTDMFQRYFPGAAVIEVPGFTYPVESRYIDENKNIDFSATMKMCAGYEPSLVAEDVVKVIDYIHRKRPEGAILCFLPGWEEIRSVRSLIREGSDKVVMCLHSKLDRREQLNIFKRPPPGVRKIILSTNIAETSVTVDDVAYVIDTGIHKESRLDIDKGVMCLDNHWISKSSMTQRKGRAGRVRAGECFHMYPRSKVDEFSDFSIPEIMRTSLTKTILDAKVYANNLNSVIFMEQLPTPPKEEAINLAVQELKELDLLNEKENLTPLGRLLVDFQLEPKLAKALVNAVVYQCVTPVVDIITLFSSETDMFATTLKQKDAIKKIKSQFSKTSDHLALMRIFEKWLEFDSEGTYQLQHFMADAKLAGHKMTLFKNLRNVHFGYLDKVKNIFPLRDNSSDNDEIVKGVIFSAVGTLLKHRDWDIIKGRWKTTNTFVTRLNHRATITPESVNFKKTKFPSDFLLYINETRSNIRRTTLIRESSVMSPLAVLLFSSNDVSIEVVSSNHRTPNLDSENQVEVRIENSKVKIFCDKEQAERIVECRRALRDCYKYFIHQMSTRNEIDPHINEKWNKMLYLLNVLMDKHSL